MARKQQLIEQRKKIIKSFSNQISKKDKRIGELEKDLELHQSAVLDLMDACSLAEENEAKTRQSLNSLTAEFGRLKRKLSKHQET